MSDDTSKLLKACVEYRAMVDRLEAENVALRADKERLDKLEKMLVDAKILPIGDNEPIEERYLRLGILRGETIRQFLDSVSVE